jgi:hypothetical protein
MVGNKQGGNISYYDHRGRQESPASRRARYGLDRGRVGSRDYSPRR